MDGSFLVSMHLCLIYVSDNVGYTPLAGKFMFLPSAIVEVKLILIIIVFV